MTTESNNENQVQALIGAKIKILSNADLGRAEGNQTHIGLLKETFDGWEKSNKFQARVLYLGRIYPCIALTDPIINPNGTQRSPKLRQGKLDELSNSESALSIIRSIAIPGDGLAIYYSNNTMDFLLIPAESLTDSKEQTVSEKNINEFKQSSMRPKVEAQGFSGGGYRQDSTDAIGLAMEGEPEAVLSIRRKRNVELRDAYVEKFGYKCSACDIVLSDVYGIVAQDLIEVHHLHPLSKRNEGSTPTTMDDLVGLCPNCHRVAHRRDPVYSPAEIKEFLKLCSENKKTRRLG